VEQRVVNYPIEFSNMAGCTHRVKSTTEDAATIEATDDMFSGLSLASVDEKNPPMVWTQNVCAIVEMLDWM
jgi:hypothetical protein